MIPKEFLLAWKNKPLLREAYRFFYREMQSSLYKDEAGPNVELGAGAGNFKIVDPGVELTNVFDSDGFDRQENIYRLSYPDASVSNFIMMDVFHHIRDVGVALREAHRALRQNGRLIICEPFMSWLGWVVYGATHPEPIRWNEPIRWESNQTAGGSEAEFAAQGHATKLLQPENRAILNSIGFSVIRVEKYPALFYLASGGYRGPCLIPYSFRHVLVPFEWAMRRLPFLFATRVIVVLEKQSIPTAFPRSV